MALSPSIDDLEKRLALAPADHHFCDDELAGLPDRARRYLRAAIAPGAPLARAARLEMRGHLKLGKRWVPFRARETLAPHEGFVWAGRAGGLISGFDSYADGTGTGAGALELDIDDAGVLRSVSFDRWGDPDNTGTVGWHRFGTTVTDTAAFAELTVPAAGRAGWHHGTDRWDHGEFFRYRLTSLQPLTATR